MNCIINLRNVGWYVKLNAIFFCCILYYAGYQLLVQLIAVYRCPCFISCIEAGLLARE